MLAHDITLTRGARRSAGGKWFVFLTFLQGSQVHDLRPRYVPPSLLCHFLFVGFETFCLEEVVSPSRAAFAGKARMWRSGHAEPRTDPAWIIGVDGDHETVVC